MKLKELEKRLKDEPDNLALRVQVAGLLREAGRSVEAVEHYRFVATAYRDQNRTQQAIAVCRSILEIAPEDAACQGLLAQLQQRSTGTHPAVRASTPSVPPSEPTRRSSIDDTPLPRPIPYHVQDPTSQKYKVSERDLRLPLPPEDTGVPDAVPSSTMDISAELETRKRGKIPSEQLKKLDEVTSMGEPSAPEIELAGDLDGIVTDKQQRLTPVRLTPIEDVMPGLSPLPRDSPHARLTPVPRDTHEDDMLTAPRDALEGRTSDEELTRPRERAKLFDDEDD